MKASIAVLPGDGIGPEVISESIKVLEAIGNRFNHDFEIESGRVGGNAIDDYGTLCPRKPLIPAKIQMQFYSVRLGVLNGMIQMPMFGQRMVFWRSANHWDCLLI